jgi:flagellar basal body P-ring formation protein FlgA
MGEMKKKVWIFCLAMVGMGVVLFPAAEAWNASPSPQEGIQGSQVITAEDVAGILETHIQMKTNDRRKRIEVKEVRGFEKVTLPPGELSYDIMVPDQIYRGGNVSAVIHFLIHGKEIKKIRVTAQVQVFADVVVARSYLKKNQVIREKDLHLLNKNISLLAPDVVTDFDEVVGKRTTLNMNSQEVFRKSMVERAPVVKKGDRITLIAENSYFRITTLGEVQEEGGRGDRIRLLNVSSKREVYGRVLDANTAQIDY